MMGMMGEVIRNHAKTLLLPWKRSGARSGVGDGPEEEKTATTVDAAGMRQRLRGSVDASAVAAVSSEGPGEF